MIFHWTMLKPFLKAASQRIKSTNLEDKSMKQDAKTITMNILNGLSVGIIVPSLQFKCNTLTTRP
ncbi:hypothetical protein LPEG9_11060 [Lacticaseibacillus paracasei]|nr:hypothetical protein LPEG9_11060 [Lacticaseibacillus paracasei]